MTLEVKGIRDFFQDGIKGGWQVFNANQLTADKTVECDVVIVGTGAGGGTAAEILSAAGLNVVLIEEGPLRTSNDFKMDERTAYRELYQEGAARAAKDASMVILQGRSVGGSTTVNWTSSFRTPELTLKQWSTVHGVKGVTVEDMAPWFEQREKRLNIQPWAMQPNANNDVIRLGCEKLGWTWHVIPRNVNGCWNLGYCGMGCPTNAKQSMLVTTIPAALKNKASLYSRVRAEKILMDGDKVTGVSCRPIKEDGFSFTGVTLTVKARHTVLSGGGINNPGLLLRSKAPDPYKVIGKRTFLHPVNAVFARYDRKIEPYFGAPQSLYSDYFQWQNGATGPMGYKIEAIPMHPALTASLLGGYGEGHHDDMMHLGTMNGLIALLRDGFIDDSPGGTVSLRDDNVPTVDYPMTDALRDGLRRSFLSMAEIQFAAGATAVRPGQFDASYYKTWKECREAILQFNIDKFRTRLGSAHVMGGCALGEDAQRSVVNSQGDFHQLQNLSVMDGSLFPTSIGANPQLSIYGLVSKLATGLAEKLAPSGKARTA
jgi:choline dehydrogenase-like flavoprotein